MRAARSPRGSTGQPIRGSPAQPGVGARGGQVEESRGYKRIEGRRGDREGSTDQPVRGRSEGDQREIRRRSEGAQSELRARPERDQSEIRARSEGDQSEIRGGRGRQGGPRGSRAPPVRGGAKMRRRRGGYVEEGDMSERAEGEGGDEPEGIAEIRLEWGQGGGR